ncbi:MAG: PAS domain S-box-containing protein [Candidatus Paceibacteria bacterium]|jgi:PAS domain S-box-containing protein
MSIATISPTGVERTFEASEIIVSKTDTSGVITYANELFLSVAGYTESEVVGMPHNLIRHPDMPRCVFQLLWDSLKSGNELFAYVINLCKNGDHYWVYAHVTPTRNAQGEITGYHSSRRLPKKSAVDKVRPLYAQLRAEEQSNGGGAGGMRAAAEKLKAVLGEVGMEYDEFVFSL